MFCKNADNENENHYNTNSSITEKKDKLLCYFRQMKNIYNWIRKVNNPNRTYYTIRRIWDWAW